MVGFCIVYCFSFSLPGASVFPLEHWCYALYDLTTPLFQLQQAALVLNASRRFRYTLDLKKEEQKEEIRRKIRAQAHVISVYLR
jgi:hypothetical protein